MAGQDAQIYVREAARADVRSRSGPAAGVVLFVQSSGTPPDLDAVVVMEGLRRELGPTGEGKVNGVSQGILKLGY